MVGDMLDRVIYLDAKTNNLMEWDFPSKDPDQLREGMTIKVKIRGRGNYYYRIVRLEREYYTRAYLKRVYIHYSDVLKFVIIIVLGKLVIQRYADFLWPW